MLNQTKASQRLIARLETTLAGRPWKDIIMDNILSNAQSLVGDGYRWDVALGLSCKLYPVTEHIAGSAYSE